MKTDKIISMMPESFTTEQARNKWIDTFGVKSCPSKTGLAQWIAKSQRCEIIKSNTSGVKSKWVRIEHPENTVRTIEIVEESSNGITSPSHEKGVKNTRKTTEEKQ